MDKVQRIDRSQLRRSRRPQVSFQELLIGFLLNSALRVSSKRCWVTLIVILTGTKLPQAYMKLKSNFMILFENG
jgi:hypothetical protein